MRDLGYLSSPATPETTLGLDAHDPRFMRVTDLAQRGKLEEAADAVAALFAENVRDLRLVVYPLFQAFREDGVACLAEVFEGLGGFVAGNLESCGPAEKRSVLLAKSLTWFFQQLRDVLVYHQTKKDAEWLSWLELGPEKLEAASLGAEDLAAALADPAYKGASELLAHLTRTLGELAEAAAARAQAQVEKAESEAPKLIASTLPKTDGAAAGAVAESASGFTLLGQMVTLRGSPQLVELLNKLRAFELLIAKKDYRKAALVSDDILRLLETFDPRKYFPELFATFGALLNQNVQAIKPHWDDRESVDWRMLEQYYQVDLESFVGSSGNR